MTKLLAQKPILTIDLKVRFQSRIYKFSLNQIIRWIVPVVILVTRIIAHFRDNAT